MKRLTLKDIAKAANLSLATVSMSLANHPNIHPRTRKLVRQISSKMGYRRPKDRIATAENNLPSSSLRHVGLLLLERSFEDPIYASLLQDVCDSLAERHLHTHLLAADHASNENELIKQAVNFAKQLDGLLVTGTVKNSVLRALTKASVPTVVLGYTVRDSSTTETDECPIVTRIISDELQMARQAVRLLVARGHRRIALVCRHIIPGLFHSRWKEGYQLEHLANGLPLDEELIFAEGSITSAISSSVEAAVRFTQLKDPPTGFIVPSLIMVHPFLRALQERGINVPPQDLIIRGTESRAQQLGLRSYLMFRGRGKEMIDLAINFINQARANPSMPPCDVIVPHFYQNLPEPEVLQPPLQSH